MSSIHHPCPKAGLVFARGDIFARGDVGDLRLPRRGSGGWGGGISGLPKGGSQTSEILEEILKWTESGISVLICSWMFMVKIS